MLIVPTRPVPRQTFSALLGNQNCQINIYQKFTCMFLDLYVDNALIIAGVQCHNADRIVRSIYLGFLGDLAFFDRQGSDDPTFDGLGTRFFLAYLETVDLVQAA